MKNFILQNWFKLILVGVFFSLIAISFFYTQDKIRSSAFAKDLDCKKINSTYQYSAKDNVCTKILRNFQLPACSFELKDIQANFVGSNMVRYSGLILNNDNQAHFLNAMIVKIYNDQNVYLSDGYTGIEKRLEPNKAMSFTVSGFLEENETSIQSLKPDIYPWFSTCM